MDAIFCQFCHNELTIKNIGTDIAICPTCASVSKCVRGSDVEHIREPENILAYKCFEGVKEALRKRDSDPDVKYKANVIFVPDLEQDPEEPMVVFSFWDNRDPLSLEEAASVLGWPQEEVEQCESFEMCFPDSDPSQFCREHIFKLLSENEGFWDEEFIEDIEYVIEALEMISLEKGYLDPVPAIDWWIIQNGMIQYLLDAGGDEDLVFTIIGRSEEYFVPEFKCPLRMYLINDNDKENWILFNLQESIPDFVLSGRGLKVVVPKDSQGSFQCWVLIQNIPLLLMVFEPQGDDWVGEPRWMNAMVYDDLESMLSEEVNQYATLFKNLKKPGFDPDLPMAN